MNPSKPSERRLRRVHIHLLTGCVLALIGGCSGPDAKEQVKIGHQVLLAGGHDVSPHIIVRTPDGGYIVAGSSNLNRTEAWAERLSSSGKMQWEYLDGPADSWDDRRPGLNRYTGAVVLSDDTVLLCGTKTLDHESYGLLTHVGTDGSVIANLNVSPRGARGFTSWFNVCSRWGKGFVLLGQANRMNGPAGWLVKLDSRGEMVWEKLEFSLGANEDLVEAADGGLLVSVRASRTEIVKLDADGKILTSRVMPGYISFVQPIGKTSHVGVIVTNLNTAQKTYWNLDENLRELSRPKTLGVIGVARAYELADDSLVAFGSVKVTGAPTAAIGRLYADDTFVSYPVAPLHESDSLLDGVPTNNRNEYAVVRMSTRSNASGQPAPGLDTVLGLLEITPR